MTSQNNKVDTDSAEAPIKGVGCGALVSVLRVLLTPSCWIQNYRYSRAWDSRLRELLSTGRFRRVDRHHAEIGGVMVWIANHPYASFTPVPQMDVRPSRVTILRAHEKLIEDTFANPAGEPRPPSNP